MRSLRIRLVLLSTLLSGIILTALSVVTWRLIEETYQDRSEIEIMTRFSRVIRDIHPRMNLNRFRNQLEVSLKSDIDEGNLLIFIEDRVNQDTIYLAPGSDWKSSLPEAFTTKDVIPQRRPEWAFDAPPEDGPPGREKGKAPPRSPKSKGNGPSKGSPKGPPSPPLPGDGAETTEMFSLEWNEAPWRGIKIDGRGYRLIGAINQKPSLDALARFRSLFLIGVPVSIALIAIGAWIVVDRALRPIRKISQTASRINAADLSERIPESPHSDDEIADLINVLNRMMHRLEGSFRHANRFSADVSHELKTPIAIMQGEVECAIRECEPDSKELQNFIVVREEVQRLKEIIESLMLLARADVGELVHKRQPFNLSAELMGLVEDAEILALPKSISISAQIEPDLECEGDPVLLRQAFLNLITNAIRYNFEGGSLKIAMKPGKRKKQIRMRIANTGPPIPENEQELVFDRFYRVDKARTRKLDGAGLGLSLVREIILGHGGELRLVESTMEQTLFEVTLPMEE